MKILVNLITSKQFMLLTFALVVPIFSFAETVSTAQEEAAQNAKMALWGEIGIGILFAAALTAFLIYKTKHDKKLHEKHLEQMKKVQANKRRAA